MSDSDRCQYAFLLIAGLLLAAWITDQIKPWLYFSLEAALWFAVVPGAIVELRRRRSERKERVA